MKILIGIPCLFGPGHTKLAIDSVVNHPDVYLLLIDNGAEQSVKDLLEQYEGRQNVSVIHNQHNVYVNPAWNQIMNYFISWNKWDLCIIMNSDLVMHHRWHEQIVDHYNNTPEVIPLPNASHDLAVLKTIMVHHRLEPVPGGIPGVFISLTKDQVKKVYPIPRELVVWYGDNWIYDIMRGIGHQTAIVHSLLCYHAGSQNVQRVAGIEKIIEQDRQNWDGAISRQVLPHHILILKTEGLCFGSDIEPKG